MKRICLIVALSRFALTAITADTPEDVFWKSVQKTDVLEEYRLYVEQYPKGKYLSDALRRIGALEAGATAKPSTDALGPGKVFKDCADCPEMVVIPAGSFEMGSDIGNSDEKPVHSVRIDKAFALAKIEVTQGHWRAVMGSNVWEWTEDCLNGSYSGAPSDGIFPKI